ncbi:MAG: NEW3 domain-containing protein [Verrucomicrobiia bacterium]
MLSRVYKQLTLVGTVILSLSCLTFSVLRAEDGSGSVISAHGTPVNTVGELTVLQACDFEHGHSELIHMLKDLKTGQTTRLRFNHRAPTRLHSGAIVRIRGEKVNEEIVVSADGSGNVETLAEATLVSGNQSTVVILINFLDANIECSAASVASLMFSSSNSVNSLYQEMSYGNVSFSGNVFGPFTINYTSTGSCDYYGWASAADAAAQAAGANLSSYTHKVYVLPKKNQCGWAGLSTIGGNPSSSWIAYCDLNDVYAHELGHSLTMQHASTDADNDNANECEYCDTSDVMGYVGIGLRHVDAPHKDELGWLPTGKVASVSSNGVYLIAPLEDSPSNTPYPQALKMVRPSGDYYYFSFRRKIGYDTSMPSQYADKLNVHHYAGSGSLHTYLVEPLGDGESFADPINGVTVTQLSHTADYVTVQVLTDCAPLAPTVTVSSTNYVGLAGCTFSYTVALQDNDTAPCSSSSFNLSAIAPAGWTASVAPTSLSLGPGQTSTVTLTVTSPNGVTNGTYSVNVNVSDNFTLAHNASTSATVVIQSPDSSRIKLAATAKNGKTRLRWNRPKKVAVSAYRVYRDDGTGNFTLIATKRTSSFQDAPETLDMAYSYYVTAYSKLDSQTVASNVATILVPAPSLKKH